MSFRRKSLGKTPLGSELRQWLQLSHESNRMDEERGTSDTDASIEELLSRRQMLRLAGIGAAGVVAGSALGRGFDPFMPQRSSAHVAVVGAGIAGLAAAYHLSRNGIRVDVYEGQPRVGGRIYSAHNVMGKGLTTELGAEFIDTDHYQMRQFARLFDLPLIDVTVKSEARLWDAYYFGGQMRRDKEILAAFKPFAKRMAADNNAASYTGYKDANAFARELDRMSISEYMQRMGISGWLYDLLNVAYLTENGSSCDVQSSLNLLGEIGTNTSGPDFDLFGKSDQRFKVKGGNHRIPQALADRLKGKIHLGNKLERISQNNRGAYVLHFANGKTAEADYLVMTMPFTTLREVDIDVDLPATKRKAIDELNYGTNAKLILGFNHHYWRQMGTVGLFFTDLPFQSGWDSSQLQGTTYASLTLFMGGQAGVDLAKADPHQEAKGYLPQIDMMFPGAMKEFNGAVTRFNWPHWPWSKASYSTYAVGQVTSFGGAERMTVGRMYFAGEHTSDDQGFMESGAETGVIAAKAIVKALA